MYMDAPKLELTVYDATNRNAESVEFTYIPSHLYHMFFEIFKNSMRATMEFHDGEDIIPNIKAGVCISYQARSEKEGRGGLMISQMKNWLQNMLQKFQTYLFNILIISNLSGSRCEKY